MPGEVRLIYSLFLLYSFISHSLGCYCRFVDFHLILHFFIIYLYVFLTSSRLINQFEIYLNGEWEKTNKRVDGEREREREI